ncbi:PREDICTED: tyramine receptor Ser-2-like [Acropora digitifera]|uniref:tyramine receptor Ser-2-like n=1 Tax=Acropora digitifera TaxID=70779 RepID=UPI00077B276F|nr:PREDICTED: tyramine receptor Ser-2-like [Acropora digitifera]
MSNDNSTIANTTGAYYDFSPSFQYPVLACHILIVFIGVIGNLIVCGAIIVNKNLRSSPTNTFIFSLAFSDLLTVSLVVPFDIESIILLGSWRHSEELCKAWITMYLITVPTSILTLLAVSVDRYKSLNDPLNRFRRYRFMTRKNALIVSMAIWIYSILFALIPIMGHRTHDEFVYEGVCYFPFTKIYTTLSSAINFILPLLATCCIYIKIYRIARSQRSIFHGDALRISEFRYAEEKKVYSRNMRAAKTISIFVAVLFSCWIPYSFISLVSHLCGTPCTKNIPQEVLVLFLMFGYLNSALNPFLFAFRNSRFKATMSLLLRPFKSRPAVRSSRRRPTLTIKNTCHSELPDLQDSDIRLQSEVLKRGRVAGDTQSSLCLSFVPVASTAQLTSLEMRSMDGELHAAE